MRPRPLLLLLFVVGFALTTAGAYADPGEAPSPPTVPTPAGRSEERANADDAAAVTAAAGEVVTVAATVDPFSPNFDGSKDKTTLVVEAHQPATISLLIRGPAGNVWRTWEPVYSDSGTRSVLYGGGIDGGGGVLPSALYTVEATATDAVGVSTTATTELRVDTVYPTASWKSVWPEPVSDQLTYFKYTAWDRAELLTVGLYLYDRLGVVGSRLGLVRERGERTLSWLPRYADNGALLYPGRYRARVRVEDDAGNVRWSGFRPWRVHRSLTAKVWSRVAGSGNDVALTFDDCYSSTGWKGVLDALKARGVKATFFCSGTFVDDYPGRAVRTRAEGHVVGSHGWDHASLKGRSVGDSAWRMRADRDVWWKVAQETTAPYFRPPYGAYDSNVLSAAGTTSHPRVIMWDVDPADWSTSSPSTISSRVLANVRGGSIVVMHTLPQTANALPAILSGLANRGLEPVTLAKMFRSAELR